MSSAFSAGDEFVPPDLDLDDLRGFLVTMMSRGWPEGLLIKQAMVSIRALHAAAERWQRTEGGYVSTAPLWLDKNERDKLLVMLRGQRSVEARALRKALEEMFPASS